MADQPEPGDFYQHVLDKTHERFPLKFVVGEGGTLPGRAHQGDAGFDLYCSQDTWIEAGQFVDIPTAVCMEPPPLFWGLIIGRSSTERGLGLRVMPGVIDSGYRGELFVGVTNLKKYAGEKTVVRKGDRLAQLIPMRLASHELRAVEVEELNDHERGIKGFGSTGR